MQRKKVYSVPGPDLQGPDLQGNGHWIPSHRCRIFDFDFDFEIEG